MQLISTAVKSLDAHSVNGQHSTGPAALIQMTGWKIAFMQKYILIIVLLPLFIGGGCGSRESTPAQKPAPEQIIIGLVPEQNIFDQIDRYQDLVDYLALKCNVSIRLKVMPEYKDVLDALGTSAIDGAFLGSFTYVLAHERFGAEVLARPENEEGSSVYHGLIFTRKDSNIRTIKDLKGKRIVFVDRLTTAGYLYPIEYLYRMGVKKYEAYFSEIYFAGTHQDAIYDVLNGRADVGAAKNTIFEKLATSDSRIRDELTIIAISSDVPENALVVRRDLGPEISGNLKQSLISMIQTKEGRDALNKFKASKFIETTDDDFRPVYSYARQINIDLKRFDIKQ